MKLLKYLILSVAIAFSIQAQARIDAYPFDDADKEAVYKKMIQELRCLVCQNQNLADSNAELAMDLRRKTYEMATQGKSEEEIVEYMTQRYGDFVLYRPPLSGSTLFLWAGPFIILFIGLFVLIRVIRARKQVSQSVEISEEDRSKAAELLKDN